MQCACAVLSYVSCLAVQYFTTLFHKRHGFRGGKILLNIKCMLWFSLQILPEMLLVIRRTERDMTKSIQYIGLYLKFPMFLCDLSRLILEKYSKTKFYKNPSSGNWVIPCGWTNECTDELTDLVNLTVAFHNFAKSA